MAAAWDFHTSNQRIVDSRSICIIFCEDKVSEPLYLKQFESDRLQIRTFSDQRSAMDNVIRAIASQKANSIDESPDEISLWCIYDYDRDTHTNSNLLKETYFNESIETAKRNNIKVAWSNDAFELWILLHFEDVDASNHAYTMRQTYYDRLSEIFKQLPSPNELLTNTLSHESFCYKKDLKQERKFIHIVLPELEGKTDIAITRARALELFHSNKTQNHLKSPCTLVHHLVEELLAKKKGQSLSDFLHESEC